VPAAQQDDAANDGAASDAGDKQHAQLVACGCVVEAETQDHLNWELAGELAKRTSGHAGRRLRETHEKVEKKKTATSTNRAAWARSCGCRRSG